jgi:hypothetical protein
VDDPYRYAMRVRVHRRLGVDAGVMDDWITLVGSATNSFTP